jgi:hypothetical protein
MTNESTFTAGADLGKDVDLLRQAGFNDNKIKEWTDNQKHPERENLANRVESRVNRIPLRPAPR